MTIPMDAPKWFRPRAYMHFDVPVGASYARSINHKVVSENGWSPLIHYMKEDRRYRPLENKTVKKPRPIMYASHRDACILASYSHKLSQNLDAVYRRVGLHESVVAYRSLGKSNYDFAKRVQDYVKARETITVMCFDVTGFFDNLDHALLKKRLKWLFNVDELSDDWYKVFRHVTKYRFVNLDDLKNVPHIKTRLDARKRQPIASIPEIKAAGVLVNKNKKQKEFHKGLRSVLACRIYT